MRFAFLALQAGLKEQGALDANGEITRLGYLMMQLPIDIRLCKCVRAHSGAARHDGGGISCCQTLFGARQVSLVEMAWIASHWYLSAGWCSLESLSGVR